MLTEKSNGLIGNWTCDLPARFLLHNSFDWWNLCWRHNKNQFWNALQFCEYLVQIFTKLCNSFTWLWWTEGLAAELLRSVWQVWNVVPMLDLEAHGSGKAGTCNKQITAHSKMPLLYKRTPKCYLHNRPWWPIGLWDVRDPTLSRQSAHS
jgi:hypothetical protein